MVGVKYRITIQKPDHTQDSYGAKVRAWTNVVEDIKATIMPVSTAEAMQMERAQMTFTHRVFFDYYVISGYLAEIKPAGRVKWDDQYYDIIAIEKTARRMVTLLIKLSI